MHIHTKYTIETHIKHSKSRSLH